MHPEASPQGHLPPAFTQASSSLRRRVLRPSQHAGVGHARPDGGDCLPHGRREAPLLGPCRMSVKLRDRLSIDVANLKEATSVIVKHHYLHRGRTMAQMPYWITLDGTRKGVLLFSLPRLSVTFQGYRPMSLIELARLWINPTVQIQQVQDSNGREHAFPVATCSVGMALRQIRQDWHGKYPHLPDIDACVSWADDQHHEGTVYRAANFEEVGKSGGVLHGNTRRPNGGRDQLHGDYRHIKTAFIYRYRRSLSEAHKLEARIVWGASRPRLSRRQRVKLAMDGRQPTLSGLELDSAPVASHAP